MIKSETFDVLSYLQSRNVRYYSSGKNVSQGWVGINCQFCLDRSNHLGINLKSKTFNCYLCGETGNLWKLIQTIDGTTSNKEVFRVIEDFQGGAYTPREKEYSSKVKFPIGTTKTFPETALSFLESRRYDPEKVIKQYDLSVTGPIGDYKHRIIIPIVINNRIMSFVGRDFTKKAAISYKNSAPETSIKDVKSCLYNLDTVIQNKAVIVEGILDVWRIGDGAVCTFGKQYTHSQLQLLRGLKKAFVLYDADASEMAYKLAHDLAAIVPSVEVLELSSGDPDDMSDADVRALRRDLKL